MFSKNSIIGVIGSGAMGSGIAQVAANAGHIVFVYDNNEVALQKAKMQLLVNLNNLIEKNKITNEKKDEILKNIQFVNQLSQLSDCSLVIEAIVENAEIKKTVFSQLETILKPGSVVASNTSSLSITSLSSAFKNQTNFLGIHFFNPATIMPLVEIIPGLATNKNTIDDCKKLIDSWGKITVIAKDTPGFIVNRVARPFYSEALRIFEEGIADMVTIDWAMKTFGQFKMGPFELMDLIGHDVNYVVTETVWKQFYFDPKFKPSISQKRLVEAGYFGKKSGRGFYNYDPTEIKTEPNKNEALGQLIFNRVLCMLINEAAEALYYQIASAIDIDLAMTKGVNYPKGLLKWADEIGIMQIVSNLNDLKNFYEEDRYRISPILKLHAKNNTKFFP